MTTKDLRRNRWHTLYNFFGNQKPQARLLRGELLYLIFFSFAQRDEKEKCLK